MKVLSVLAILFVTTLAGCASSLKDFNAAIEKNQQYRFCALAVEPVANGATDNAVAVGRLNGNIHCGNGEETARRAAIQACSSRLGKTCVLAYEYDRNHNSYRSNQTGNINAYQAGIAESKMKRCDGYGFNRGTTPFAQCMQQVEQQESMDTVIQMQQNEIARQNQQEYFRKAQCYATGRLDC